MLAFAAAGGASAANSPPTALFTVAAGGSPLARSFDASASTDTDGTIQSYAWDFGDGSDGSGVTVSHAYAAPGSYQVTLTVADDAADTGQLTSTVRINASPTAAFTPSVPDPEDSLRLRLDASASVDPDGTIASYAWSFGDGQTGSGKIASHVYATGGHYTVALTVTDSDGATAQASTAVTVNTPPVAAFAAARGADTLTYVFDASASADADGSIVSYEWDFDDGDVATGKTVTHRYTDGDTYEVTLVVTDDKGAVAEVSHEVEPNEPPEADLDCEVSDDDPNLVECDGSFSDDPDGEVTAWSWSFGDGGTASGEEVTHRYAAPGTYTITITVTDDRGASASAKDSIRVNAPPVPAFTVTYDPADPLAVTLDAASSKDADGTVRSWDWSFGDGDDGLGRTVRHTYERYGVYTVTLTVEDDDLAEGVLKQKAVVAFARGGYLVRLGGGTVALDGTRAVLGIDCATGQRIGALAGAAVSCRDGFAPLPRTFLTGVDRASLRALTVRGPVLPAARASVDARRSFAGAGRIEARWTAFERALAAAVGTRPAGQEPVEVDPAGAAGTAADAAYAAWLQSVDELVRLGTAGSAAAKALAKGLVATAPPAGGWVVAPGLVVGGPRNRVVGVDCVHAAALGRAVPAARPKGACRGGVSLARGFLAGQARAAARAFAVPGRVSATVEPDARRAAAYLGSAGALEPRWKALLRAVSALRLPPSRGPRRTAAPSGAVGRAGAAWLRSLEDLARIESARAVVVAALRAGLATPAR